MLVRWEYWSGAGEIIADNFLTGIGGNNFGTHYTQYKAAKSLETVRDPHCFILTMFSNYGIIGLAGFLACLLVPLLGTIKKTQMSVEKENSLAAMLKKIAITGCFISIMFKTIGNQKRICSANGRNVLRYRDIVYRTGFSFRCCNVGIARSQKCCQDTIIQRAALLCGIFCGRAAQPYRLRHF
jgi:hypothetical protein